jgi:phosphoglycerate dehydrogenase-like enzyme
MDNVVVSPHLAGSDAQSLADMGAEAARSIVTLFRGDWPEGAVVNAELKPGWRWQR